MRGQWYDWDSPHYTVANAKGIYNDLLTYFQTRPDKLFIAITAPPDVPSERAANARAFNYWLLTEWLREYPLDNVQVWDFYNVLSSKWRQLVYQRPGMGDGKPSSLPQRNDPVSLHRWHQHRGLSRRRQRRPPLTSGQPQGRGRVPAAAQYLVQPMEGQPGHAESHSQRHVRDPDADDNGDGDAVQHRHNVRTAAHSHTSAHPGCWLACDGLPARTAARCWL